MFSSNASQVSSSANYIEDFFSAWLRTGTGSSQTVTTGIEEDTGALVISKSRSAATDWAWYDTFRGATKDLVSNSTAAQTTQSQGLTSFNSNGHTWGTLAKVNTSGATYVDFVLKPQPKFFDVVTYTGNGVAGRTVAHNLGAVPGFIIVKRTNSTGSWACYHRSVGNTAAIQLNYALTPDTYIGYWNNTNPTATNFTLGDFAEVNGNGDSFVAYLFAHDSGGFGLSGEDNVISCGSYTGNGSTTGPVVTLGYEPQWVMVKRSSEGGGIWTIVDNMRGMPDGSNAQVLIPNTADAEFSDPVLKPLATGFQVTSSNSAYNGNGSTIIYIAIRRGPMKTPTTGTSVFSPNAQNTGTTPLVTTNFPVDLSIGTDRTGASRYVVDRLRGTTAASSQYLETNSTIAEAASGGGLNFANNTGFTDAFLGYSQSIFWNFRRAPGFMDVCCFTGTGVAKTESHNLGVAPELMIVKSRAGIGRDWAVYIAPMGNNYFACLNNGSFQGSSSTMWNDTTPTSSVFTVGTNLRTNNSGQTYVNYLFASCPGVSKVGSYTGTGTTQQINCGFTAGARFVLIKRTDSTGDWYVWDSARGIVAGNDPYLLLNSTAAEVTSTDYVDTYSAGFEISSTAPAAINASGGTFIYLAIA